MVLFSSVGICALVKAEMEESVLFGSGHRCRFESAGDLISCI